MTSHNLINGIRRKSEKRCAGLRNYEEPTNVKVFKLNKHGEMELIRIEPPTKEPDMSGYFNGRKGKK
jgi:hypothetical protein